MKIARILCLSERTVNYHVQNIILKLTFATKSQRSAAQQLGLLSAS
jgi:LuxR family transcriptional regulator